MTYDDLPNTHLLSHLLYYKYSNIQNLLPRNVYPNTFFVKHKTPTEFFLMFFLLISEQSYLYLVTNDIQCAVCIWLLETIPFNITRFSKSQISIHNFLYRFWISPCKTLYLFGTLNYMNFYSWNCMTIYSLSWHTTKIKKIRI